MTDDRCGRLFSGCLTAEFLLTDDRVAEIDHDIAMSWSGEP